jgi:hypothetical protein
MVQSTRVNGEITRPMGEGNFGMLTEMCMKDNGRMIRPMGTECTSM